MSGLTRRAIHFLGENTNLAGRGEKNDFWALANNEAIEAIEGYAIYARVKRPQRKSITVLEGYEPMAITVPLLFDESTAEMRAASERWRGHPGSIEEDMQALEWMAGRGVKFKTPQEGGVGTPGEGNSPLVQIHSVASDGKETLLVPYQYQTPTLKWVVSASSGTGIEWDRTVGTGVLRDNEGSRVRQACVVTLTEFVQPAYDVGLNSAAARAKAREKAEHQYETVTVPVDGRYRSLGEIAAYYCKSATAISELVKANAGNRAIGSRPDKRLKRGTRVKVPQTAMQL
jgi:hypothetical protein